MPSSVPHPEGLTPRSSSSYPCRSPQLDPPSVLDHRHHRPLPAAIFCCSPLEHTRRGTRAPSVSSVVASGNKIRRRHRRGIPQRLVPGGALTLHDLAGGVRPRHTADISTGSWRSREHTGESTLPSALPRSRDHVFGSPRSCPETREAERMAHYLLQVAYTAESWSALVKTPHDRLEAVRPVVERLGGRLDNAWLAFGDYDVVAVFEAPDNVTA